MDLQTTHDDLKSFSGTVYGVLQIKPPDFTVYSVCEADKVFECLNRGGINGRAVFRVVLRRCMHCMQRGVGTIKLSDRPSVCPSGCLAWFVTKREKLAPTFLYHMKDHLSYFLGMSEKREYAIAAYLALCRIFRIF